MANPAFQHKINQSAVFHYLRDHGPAYKKQIAEGLGISLPSVTRALNALTERGFARYTEDRKNKQSRTVPYFGITIQTGIVIAMDILKGTIAGRDLGVVLPIHQFRLPSDQPLPDRLALVIDEYVKGTLGREESDIRSICIGLPGIVNVETGVVERAIYHPDLEHVPIRDPLAQRYHCPVFVDNVVNLAAYANYCEYHKRHGNIVACDIGMEIGAGLVVNHSVYRGENHLAGETGFFINDLDRPAVNYKKTCTFRSLNEDMRRTRVLGGEFVVPSCEEDEASCLANVARLFELAHQGSPGALQILHDYIVRIALMLNKIEILLNPRKIVVGGDVCEQPHSREVFLGHLNEVYAPIRQMEDPVCYSDYGAHVALYGACEMGLETCLSEEFPYTMK